MMSITIKAIAFFMAVSSYSGADINRNDVSCMAHAIYHEARGEPLIGQVAVGWVVKNRVGHRWHKDSVCGVVYQKGHFSNLHRSTPIKNKKAYREAVDVAILVTTGFVNDPTEGSINYHNPVTAPSPKWDFKKLVLLGDIHNHRFYKEKS